MTVGIILLVVGMLLVLMMMKEAPTAAAIAAIPLMLPGIIVLSVDSIGSIRTDVKEDVFVFIFGALALYAIHFWLKVLLKTMFK
ncbi:MAG: hypothetical protein WBF77_12720 [Sulfurimonadaceae bacterium]